ncbi:hypothetical protein GDO86_010415 [Hymenochirus boettgeri]|uniref:Uncharacterized protein n=1 Tax=Hymenochirus boettgeri TaxID=247094 RepID=A0A8T2JQA9_9PIPI|nr:hypothetical protein GDO86_010415 [Hymenochirus boettgeri]
MQLSSLLFLALPILSVGLFMDLPIGTLLLAKPVLPLNKYRTMGGSAIRPALRPELWKNCVGYTWADVYSDHLDDRKLQYVNFPPCLIHLRNPTDVCGTEYLKTFWADQLKS